MKSSILVVAAAAAVLVGCSSDKKNTPLPFDQAPVSVRLGVEKAFPDSKVKKIEKEVYKDGVVHYEVKLRTKSGENKTIELTPDGELLEDH